MEKTLDDIAHEWAYVESQHSEDKYSVGRICFDRGVAEMKKRAENLIEAVDLFVEYYLVRASNSEESNALIKALETYRKSLGEKE